MLHTIASYLRLAFPFILLIGVWRFGDWKNWKKYYPTILFIISVDFFISILTYEYPLWTFHGAILIPNHTITDFLIAFTGLSQMALIYLSRYPYKSEWYRQLVYVALWASSYILIEFIFMFAKLITYNHGWNIGWSILVWFFVFIGLRLHYTKPLWAWLLCFLCTAFMIIYFHIPISKLK
jgi:hypothetical protein